MPRRPRWRVRRLSSPTDAREVAAALDEARRLATGVFNYGPNGEEDHRRRQLALPDPAAPVASGIERRARARLTRRGHRPGAAVMLYSAPGCREQALHTDYDARLVRRLAAIGVAVPVAVLVAIMPSTEIIVGRERARVAIPAGSAFLFEGDLVHAGAAYDSENIRLHFYPVVDERLEVRDQTFLVLDE